MVLKSPSKTARGIHLTQHGCVGRVHDTGSGDEEEEADLKEAEKDPSAELKARIKKIVDASDVSKLTIKQVGSSSSHSSGLSLQ